MRSRRGSPCTGGGDRHPAPGGAPAAPPFLGRGDAPTPARVGDGGEGGRGALSTAPALWGGGGRAGALKWLGRAAEHASDVNQASRALQFLKAAGDISPRLSN